MTVIHLLHYDCSQQDTTHVYIHIIKLYVCLRKFHINPTSSIRIQNPINMFAKCLSSNTVIGFLAVYK
jgi:hypothetical protein